MGSTNKTVTSNRSVDDFLDSVDDPQRREDARAVCEMMRELTGEAATMWGTSIVGFGRYHYRYDSGREGDFMCVGFSPRKQNLSLYIMPGFEGQADLLERLGKHRTGKSCLYINRLSDVDESVLKSLILTSYQTMQSRYNCQD